MRLANCHSARKYYAKGLCASCYNTRRQSTPSERAKRSARAAARGYNRHSRPSRTEATRAATHKFRLKKYGLTEEKFVGMILRQEGLCAICQSELGVVFDIDHNHETGVVRGLLCKRCNKALGGFRDSPSILASALDYLCPNGPRKD